MKKKPAKSKPRTTRTTAKPRGVVVHRLFRAIAIEVHSAGLKEVRRREKFDDGKNGLYEMGSPRLIAAMEGIAKYIIKHYRPNASDQMAASAKPRLEKQ